MPTERRACRSPGPAARRHPANGGVGVDCRQGRVCGGHRLVRVRCPAVGGQLLPAFFDQYWGDPEPAQTGRIIRVELRE